MLKNISVLFLFAICATLGSSLTFAQTEMTATNTAPTTSLQVVEEVQKERSSRTGLTYLKRSRIINLCANISNKLEATLVRLSTITNRLDRRIIKMEKAGLDVTEAKEKLSAAKSQLAAADAFLKNIDTLVAQVSGSEKPRDAWTQVKETFRKAHDAIKQSKQLLKESIVLLRQARPVSLPEETASTTGDTI